MKQGCRLARLFDKGIRDFYARNQSCLMNTQPRCPVFIISLNKLPYTISLEQKRLSGSRVISYGIYCGRMFRSLFFRTKSFRYHTHVFSAVILHNFNRTLIYNLAAYNHGDSRRTGDGRRCGDSSDAVFDRY